MKYVSRPAWLPWAAVGTLALLCGLLAFLQYRWTGDVSQAQRSSLYNDLNARLEMFARAFNANVSDAIMALQPSAPEVEAHGRAAAYEARYMASKQNRGMLFRQIGLAIPQPNGAQLFLNLDPESGHFAETEWPENWRNLRDRLTRASRDGRGMGPGGPPEGNVFELPRFDGRREQEWLIVAIDSVYVSDHLLPSALNRYLAENGHLDYDVDVVSNRRSEGLIYASLPRHAPVLPDNADATASLLEIRNSIGPGPRPGPPPDGNRGPGPPPGNRGGGPGHWRVLVRHRAGSLEAVVARTQRRNLGLSAAVLLLILGTVAILVRLSRHAHRLAELQMGFVAGVSHELKTPLTVIRTCAFNLRNPAFRNREDQVERYGQLIEAESRKLETLVEQVLRFAGAEAGQAVRERIPVSVKQVVADAIESRREAMKSRNIFLESHIADKLPDIPADENALRHALENLLDNAMKYGTGPESNWIGIYADATDEGRRLFVEIRVADRGSGIEPDEQARIFDAFYRGRKAVRDQVHGTGLGLNLVKTIIEAHGGTIGVKSTAAAGTEFRARLPAASL